MGMRWGDYFMDRDYVAFWRRRLASPGSSACVILGSGFDPRAALGLLRLEEVCDSTRLAHVAFAFKPPKPIGQHAEKLARLSAENAARLNTMCSRRLCLEEAVLYDRSGHPTGSLDV